MKLDLHNHTHYSGDAITRPETLLKTAARQNLVVAATEHDNTGSWRILKALKGGRERVVFGEEVATTKNGRPAGELMGLFMNAPIKARESPDVIDELHAQGALLVVPHPFDSFRRNFQYINEIIKEIDLVEVLNARTYMQNFNKKAERFAAEHNLARCAGSDSHTPEEIGAACVELEAADLEEARKKLLKGECKIVGGTTGLKPHAKTALARHGLLKPR